MRKGVVIAALALVSLLALNGTVFMALADPPTVVIDPVQGNIGESFNFDVTATSRGNTVEEITVKDPEGKAWVLESHINTHWIKVWIWLDPGESIRITWPEAGISTDDDVNMPTVLRWKNVGGTEEPHTSLHGTYSIAFKGYGCHYFYCGSFFVVPEGPLGTVSFLLMCVASLVMYKRVSPKIKL